MSDLKSIIKKIGEIDNLFTSNFGVVISISNNVACVVGLVNAFFYEVVKFANGDRGIVISIEQEYLYILIFGANTVLPDMEVYSTNKTFNVKLGKGLIGKVLNGYGEVLCGTEVEYDDERPVERDHLQIGDVESVSSQLVTGIALIDWFCPVGLGQREAIISPRGVNEESIIKHTIKNLKDRHKTLFIYCGIGQKVDFAPNLLGFLKENHIENFIFVVANSSDDVFMRDVSPFVACTIAEYFKDLGYDVVVFFYDLTEHAIAHREIALTIGMAAGREAYPADIVYLHSRLLERFANFKTGSMTAFPFAMLGIGEDMSGGYIPTNVISITDGQILFSEEKYNKGQNPAIDIGQSVSRIGYGIQNPYMRKLCGTLKLQMSRAERLEASSQFSCSYSENDQALLNLSAKLREFLNQEEPYPLFLQILILHAIVKRNIEMNSVNFIKEALKHVRMEKKILNGDEQVINSIFDEIVG